MHSSLAGLLELLVVLAFGLGWAVLELVALGLDDKRQKSARRSADTEKPPAGIQNR
jgi:hypothetical protein